MPKVSIIIPTFNSARVLPAAVASIAAQTYGDYQIIIVDDGSTDNTPEVVGNCGHKTQYVRQSNLGPAAARNAGIRVGSGDYLVFLDADDVLLPIKLEIQSAFLDKHPDVGMVYSDGYRVIRQSNGIEERELFSRSGFLLKGLGESEQSLRILASQNAFPIHTAMVRRRGILDIGGFDETLAALEDWDLWYRLAENHKFSYVEGKVAEYRANTSGHNESLPNQKKARMQIEGKIEASSSFCLLPALIRSEAYFLWGVMNLQFGEAQLATDRFQKALKCNPLNLYALFAYWLTKFLGGRAVLFYRLKRDLFGLRRLPGT